MSTYRTPLYEAHQRANGRMVEFAGYMMPVLYKGTGLVAEHHAVRRAAGLFDVSHMGRLHFKGPEALQMVSRLITNDVLSLGDGKAQYTAICKDDGGILDDAISYCHAPDDVMMVVNASNAAKMIAWFRERMTGDAQMDVITDEVALLALQGPKAYEIAEQVIGGVRDMKPFELRTRGDLVVATTGYTGEAGFELFVPSPQAEELWEALLEVGGPMGLVPAGLGCRDTLRLEMKYCLYGNEIDESTNPIEAGLGWVTKLEKPGGFIGRDALVEIKKQKPPRRLVGLELTGRGIARQGYRVLSPDGQPVGTVTSGTMSPSLGKAIAVAYVDKPHHKNKTELQIDVRGRSVPARVTKTPFYRGEQ